jgi:hypothetical protein
MLAEGLPDSPPIEMLPEYSPPPIRFVIWMPSIQTAPLSEIDHIATLREVPTEDSLPTKPPPIKELPKRLKRQGAKDKSTTLLCSPRRLFTDNWNSFWHIALGVMAIKFKMLVPLFIFYQFLDVGEINVFVDIVEFLCGYMLGFVFSLI